MLIKRAPKTQGNFFAIWPRRTPDGWRALERLHYRFVEGWGWGSCGYWEYARWVPDKEYDEGKRRQFERDEALKRCSMCK